MCDISCMEMVKDAFKEKQPAFLSWSPVRILSETPITFQFKAESQAPALSSIHPAGRSH